MNLDDAFSQLHALGLTSSHNDFSRKWLNKSARYMSMLRATGRDPSMDALARLLANLRLHYRTYEASRLAEMRQRANQLKPLLDRANKALLTAAEARILVKPW